MQSATPKHAACNDQHGNGQMNKQSFGSMVARNEESLGSRKASSLHQETKRKLVWVRQITSELLCSVDQLNMNSHTQKLSMNMCLAGKSSVLSLLKTQRSAPIKVIRKTLNFLQVDLANKGIIVELMEQESKDIQNLELDWDIYQALFYNLSLAVLDAMANSKVILIGVQVIANSAKGADSDSNQRSGSYESKSMMSKQAHDEDFLVTTIHVQDPAAQGLELLKVKESQVITCEQDARRRTPQMKLAFVKKLSK